MINISKNGLNCIYREMEMMEHSYNCKKLNETEANVKYENIYGGNLKNMKIIVDRFKQSMNKRNEKLHVIQNCDPSNSVLL